MKTGKVVWDVEIADYKQGYASTPAPLIVKDKIIVGIAGGEFAIRGFLDAYDVNTGKRAWRFWTIPAPGEPGSETWPADRMGTRRRADVAVRQLRPRAEHALLGHRQSEPGFLRRQPHGRQPLLRIADRARRRYRHAQVALPVHTARHARLGRESDSRCSPTSRLPASRARSSWWPTATGSSTCSIAPAASSSARNRSCNQTWAKEIGADGRPVEIADQRPTREGHADLPRFVRWHQLHVAVVRRVDKAAVRDRARDVPDLHRRGAARGLQGRAIARWADAQPRARFHAARRAARHRSADRRAQVGDQASRPVLGRRADHGRRRRLQRHQRRPRASPRIRKPARSCGVIKRAPRSTRRRRRTDRRPAVCGDAVRHDA